VKSNLAERNEICRDVNGILDEVLEAVSYLDSGFHNMIRRILRRQIDPIRVNRWAARLDDAHKRFTVRYFSCD